MDLRNRFLKRLRRLFKKPVIWGNLKTVKPFSEVFGYDRGVQSIARYYIDNFIFEHSAVIQNTVLEIGDNRYTTIGAQKVTHSDVLSLLPENKNANLILDLTNPSEIKENYYDCIIFTQTLNFIFDFHKAIDTIFRMLKEGGVLLITVSGISQISQYDKKRWGDYWRFTDQSLKLTLEKQFKSTNLHIETFGNVLSSVAFLEGLSSNELTQKELNFRDENYQLIICAKAVK